MDQSPRRFLTNVLEAAGVVLGVLKLLLMLAPESLVVEAEGHAAGHATASAYTLAAETGRFTLTGGAASMRVSGV